MDLLFRSREVYLFTMYILCIQSSCLLSFVYSSQTHKHQKQERWKQEKEDSKSNKVDDQETTPAEEKEESKHAEVQPCGRCTLEITLKEELSKKNYVRCT